MVSSTDGSSMVTVWNLLTKALSFSKYFWYSSNVVAPIVLNSPRARAGFRILAASIAPCPPPVPINVWISSINKMISPLELITSLITAFNRSSNSPLYLAPATNAAISSVKICFVLRFSGTSCLTILQAIPSTMAVLPTPGSPSKMGLFFFLLDKIWSILLISSSLPMIGSSLPFSASSFRLTANFLSELYWFSAFWSVTFLPFLNSVIAAFIFSEVAPKFLRMVAALSFPSIAPSNMSSRVMNSSSVSFRYFFATASALFASLVRNCLSPPCTFGYFSNWTFRSLFRMAIFTPILLKRNSASFSSVSMIPFMRWTVSTPCCSIEPANCCALRIASWAFMVKLSYVIV